MDQLLDQLRAAVPQAKATRQQRRQAWLGDKPRERVASGQKTLETGENVDSAAGGDGVLLSPTSAGGFLSSEDASTVENGGAASEGEDTADRAAILLQGLRGKH
ncbi:hypothetical protein LTR56_027548 [Elasticomyces elasticus]|nr:hypothetical protein LTR56_027548 [Elasticomyces elasticus]KAK3618050.1 hypothetical protein LTR22_026511 [Elasticomyces elasticus]